MHTITEKQVRAFAWHMEEERAAATVNVNGGGQRQRQGAVGAAYGDHLRYRDTCVRGAVHNGGGGIGGKSRDSVEGEDTDHHAAGEAVQEAFEIRQETKNRLR